MLFSIPPSESLLDLVFLSMAADGGSASGPASELRQALWDHHRYLLSLLRYKTGSDEIAEDLLQDTYLSFLRNADRPVFSDSGKLKNYLITIALNKVRDYYRSVGAPSRLIAFKTAEEANAWLENLPSLDSGHAERLVERADAEERRNLVGLVMERLPEKYRSLLEVKFTQGLDNPEAALKLGIGIKALESRLFRAKAAFKKEFLQISLFANEKNGNAVNKETSKNFSFERSTVKKPDSCKESARNL